jgi:hypothetical protein
LHPANLNLAETATARTHGEYHFFAAGDLSITASWNLGGLGATDGPPITYNWMAGGLLPPLLPWLAILALLALKPNRSLSAWWIWLPLACLAAGWHYVELGLQTSSNGLSQDVLEIILDIPVALAFGLAALWLLAPCLARCHRFRTCLGILAVLAGFSVFSFGAAAGWNMLMEPIVDILDPRHCAATSVAGMALTFLVPLALQALVVAAAIVLCGLACRGRHRRFRLCLWLFVSLLAVWYAVLASLCFLCRLASPGILDFLNLLAIVPLMVAVTFAMLLPFLILSWLNTLFGGRLRILFHLERETNPGTETFHHSN